MARYRQDHHDRMDERRGMDRYERRRRHDSRDERRGMERYEDRRHEDREHRSERRRHRSHENDSWVTGNDPRIGRNDFAGMPRDVHMRDYPRSRRHPGGRLDDSMREIDSIQTGSERDLERYLSNQK